jgi:hypothetical protein
MKEGHCGRCGLDVCGMVGKGDGTAADAMASAASRPLTPSARPKSAGNPSPTSRPSRRSTGAWVAAGMAPAAPPPHAPVLISQPHLRSAPPASTAPAHVRAEGCDSHQECTRWRGAPGGSTHNSASADPPKRKLSSHVSLRRKLGVGVLPTRKLSSFRRWRLPRGLDGHRVQRRGLPRVGMSTGGGASPALAHSVLKQVPWCLLGFAVRPPSDASSAMLPLFPHLPASKLPEPQPSDAQLSDTQLSDAPLPHSSLLASLPASLCARLPIPPIAEVITDAPRFAYTRPRRALVGGARLRARRPLL